MPARITFTPEQREEIARLFPTTITQVLADRYGCSVERVMKEAKSMGLTKDPDHRYRQRLKGCVMGWQANTVDGKIVIPNRETTWKENFKTDPEKNRRRALKLSESVRKIRQEEKRRILFNLPTKTKLNVRVQPHAVLIFKQRLRRAGYKIKRGTRVAYYDEHTRHRDKFENMKKGDPGYVYFEYKPITERE